MSICDTCLIATLALPLLRGYRCAMNALAKISAPPVDATPPADPDDGLARDEHGLTYREDNFARELVNSGNLQRAYRVAYHTPPHWTPDAVYKAGWRIRERPRVSARLVTLRQEADARTVTTLVETVKYWHDIATADPAEIVRLERYACRHCYGEGGHHQWIDEREYADALAEWSKASDKALKAGAAPPDAPECTGGFGYSTKREPNHDCLRCFGQGMERVFLEDTRNLSDKARRLYKGVKQTRNGIEVFMHDQSQARVEMAKLLGWLAGKGEAAVPASLTQQPVAPKDTAKLSDAEVEAYYKTLLN